jgi:DNA-binding IclR family transcriptional regulator
MPADMVKSAKRVLEVLECFAQARRPMTGTEIGERLGYPKSSTNALVHSLVSLGYLDLDEAAKTYFPTMRVLLLGDWLPSMLPEALDLDAILTRVRDRTKETVTLSAQAGQEMVFIRILPSKHPIALNLDVGTRAPLVGSAVGMALLSALGDDQLAILIRRSADGRSRNPADRDRLHEKIRKVRENGYAIAYDGVLPDTGAIAVALPIDPPASPIVLGVGGPVERIRLNEAAIASVMLEIVSELKRPAARPAILKKAGLFQA